MVPSDFMRLLRVDPDLTDPGFAFWILWTLYRAGAPLEYQKYTTGIRNLNIPSYLEGTSVPVPADLSEQRRLAAEAETFDTAVSAIKDETDRLRDLRSNLLTALLSGEHEIPESYDELMEV